LDRFRQQYQQDSSRQPVTRAAIFHYVYAVLNDPEYLQKYDRNLRRDFPHIPFYRDFWVWAGFGKSMMDLHIGFENARPAQLKRADVPDERSRRLGLSPKTLLRADLQHGIIELDSETTLTGIPAEAWQYKLGGRSALEWVLDQYKEKKPKDPTIREKFNTYRFADYKEVVVDLLKRVTTVSVETVQIIRAMKKAAR
jgi:predicted helicase